MVRKVTTCWPAQSHSSQQNVQDTLRPSWILWACQHRCRLRSTQCNKLPMERQRCCAMSQVRFNHVWLGPFLWLWSTLCIGWCRWAEGVFSNLESWGPGEDFFHDASYIQRLYVQQAPCCQSCLFWSLHSVHNFWLLIDNFEYGPSLWGSWTALLILQSVQGYDALPYACHGFCQWWSLLS